MAVACYAFGMARLREQVAAKQAELDRLRARAPGGLANLEHVHDLELTDTSNAIEGNTLTAAATMLVIDQGITVGGKPLKDHLEAIDHHAALQYRPGPGAGARGADRGRCTQPAQPGGAALPDIAGRYADQGRFVLTEAGRHAFPSPAEVSALMGDFARWLGAAPYTPATAFAVHRRLVDIHPFNDGNGRTARLLMNLVLIRGGYPPVAVRPEDRLDHVRALQAVQSGQGDAAFNRLLFARLDATLDAYLRAAVAAVGPERS